MANDVRFLGPHGSARCAGGDRVVMFGRPDAEGLPAALAAEPVDEPKKARPADEPHLQTTFPRKLKQQQTGQGDEQPKQKKNNK